MATYRIPEGVLVTGSDVGAIRLAIRRAYLDCRRNGLPIPPAWDRLSASLAGVGQSDRESEATGHADEVSITEAARLLGCSARTARRLAPALGGRKHAGVWLVRAGAIHDYLKDG